MVESKVPNTCINHSISADCHHSSNDCTRKTVVPVVKFINRQCTCDESGTEKWRVDGDELPESWVVIGEELQLGIQVKIKKDEASEGGSRVSGGEGFERVIDRVLVTGADAAVVHDLAEAIPSVGAGWDNRLASGKEVRT